MGGLVVYGVPEQIPELRCESWLDNPALRLRMPEDGCARPAGTWVRGIVVHTTRGLPMAAGGQAPVRAGPGRYTRIAEATNRWWSTNGSSAGAHLVVDYDGSVACLADLGAEQTYHAGPVNRVTIGIELAQEPDGGLYTGQINAAVTLIDWLTRRFSIQRQFSWPYKGPLERMKRGGLDVVGVYGHRDVTATRGFGDPGDAIFKALASAGYEAFDVGRGEDVSAWALRQDSLRLRGIDVGPADGLPGPRTATALKAAMLKPHGVWVERPGD